MKSIILNFKRSFLLTLCFILFAQTSLANKPVTALPTGKNNEVLYVVSAREKVENYLALQKTPSGNYRVRSCMGAPTKKPRETTPTCLDVFSREITLAELNATLAGLQQDLQSDLNLKRDLGTMKTATLTGLAISAAGVALFLSMFILMAPAAAGVAMPFVAMNEALFVAITLTSFVASIPMIFTFPVAVSIGAATTLGRRLLDLNSPLVTNKSNSNIIKVDLTYEEFLKHFYSRLQTASDQNLKPLNLMLP